MHPAPPDSEPAEHVARAEALLDILHGNWKTQAVGVAAELRLADLLADGPRTSQAAGVHPLALHRLLRALTTLDLCTEFADGRFQITATGALLATNSPGSLRSWTLWWAAHLGPVWQHLRYSIKTGRSARQMLLDTEGVDQPHAITGAKAAVEQAGLANRCQCVAGDFFQSVPADGAAYLLKTILHDWNDADAHRILVNCRRAMSPDARLLIVEQVLPDRLTHAPAHQSSVRSDLNMLVALGTGERTQAQFRDLLHATGLRQTRVLPAGRFFTVIESQVMA